MAGSARINPGNISVRVGKTLELYEEAVARSDPVTAANLLDLLCDYVSVHMTRTQIKEYDRMPGFAYGDKRGVHQVFQDLRKRLQFILGVAKRHNVFAWHQPEVGDSSALDDDGKH
ncbi:MAG: hypothetical protein ACYC2H_06490 [Thermoplasmatota archaeon]